jgi:hypothetical protein
MGRRLNPNCKVTITGLPDDAAFAAQLGIDLSDAMFAAFCPPGQDCEQVTHAVIAKDEETYFDIMARASDLGIPVPPDMITEAQVNRPAAAAVTRNYATYSACCGDNKNVRVILIGELHGAAPTGSVPRPEQLERFSVGGKLALFCKDDPNSIEPADSRPIVEAEVSIYDNITPCP